MELRVIIMSNESGSEESVVFTADFDAPADDWCRPGQSVDEDETDDYDLPATFPLDCVLNKET